MLSSVLPRQVRKREANFTVNPLREPGSRRPRGRTSEVHLAKEDTSRKGSFKHIKPAFDHDSAARKAPINYRKPDKGLSKLGHRAGYDEVQLVRTRNAVRKHKMERRGEQAVMANIPKGQRKYLQKRKKVSDVGFRASLRAFQDKGTPVPKRYTIPDHLPGFTMAQLMIAKQHQSNVDEDAPVVIHDDKGIRKHLRKLASVFAHPPYRKWQHHFGAQPRKVKGKSVPTSGVAAMRIATVERMLAKQPTLLSVEHLAKLKDLLIQAGDVELNPGPCKKGCRCKKCKGKVPQVDLADVDRSAKEQALEDCAAFLFDEDKPCPAGTSESFKEAERKSKGPHGDKGFHRKKAPPRALRVKKLIKQGTPPDQGPIDTGGDEYDPGYAAPPAPELPPAPAPPGFKSVLSGEFVPPHIVHKAITLLCGDPASVTSSLSTAPGKELGLASVATVTKLAANYDVVYLRFDGYLPSFTQHWWFAFYYLVDRLFNADISLLSCLFTYWKLMLPLFFVTGFFWWMSWFNLGLQLTLAALAVRWTQKNRVLKYLRGPTVYGKRMTGYIPHLYQEAKFECNPYATREVASDVALRVIRTEANFPLDQMDVTVAVSTQLFVACAYEETQVFQDVAERGTLTFEPGCTPTRTDRSDGAPWSAALRYTATATESVKQHFQYLAQKVVKESKQTAAGLPDLKTFASFQVPFPISPQFAQIVPTLLHSSKDFVRGYLDRLLLLTPKDFKDLRSSLANGLRRISNQDAPLASTSGLEELVMMMDERTNFGGSTITSEDEDRLPDDLDTSSHLSSSRATRHGSTRGGSTPAAMSSRCSRARSSRASKRSSISSSISSSTCQSPTVPPLSPKCAAPDLDTISLTTPASRNTSRLKSCEPVSFSCTPTCVHGSHQGICPFCLACCLVKTSSTHEQELKQASEPVECPVRPVPPSETVSLTSCLPSTSPMNMDRTTFSDWLKEMTASLPSPSNSSPMNSPTSASK